MSSLGRVAFLFAGVIAACRPVPSSAASQDGLTVDRTVGSGGGQWWRPIVRLSVRADGRVTVTRHHWLVDYMKSTVTDSAPFTTEMRVAPARARALLARFEEAGYFAIDSAAYLPGGAGCMAASTDQRSYRLTLRSRGRTRTVEFYDGCIDERAWSPASGARNREAGTYVRPSPPPVVASLLRLVAATDSLAVWDPGR